MKKVNQYHDHRFPRDVISTAFWLYQRFSLSFRDLEDYMANVPAHAALLAYTDPKIETISARV